MKYSLKDYLKEWEEISEDDPKHTYKDIFTSFNVKFAELKGTPLFDYLESKSKAEKYISRAIYFYVSGISIVIFGESLGFNPIKIMSGYEQTLEYFQNCLKDIKHKYVNVDEICNLVLKRELQSLDNLITEHSLNIDKNYYIEKIKMRVSWMTYTFRDYRDTNELH